MSISKGRTQVVHSYGAYGYTRGGGKTFHGGSDETLIDDKTIIMPDYKGKSISGKVVSSCIVTNKRNLTWEWGHYVCVQLDAKQTDDNVNFLYFCHNTQNLVKVGQRVKTGDALAIMGCTGNAALASPPTPHCHVEARATRTGKGLDPSAYTGHPNAQGIYGAANKDKQYKATVLINGLRLRTLPQADSEAAQVDSLKKGAAYPVKQTKLGWAFLQIAPTSGGWACIEDAGGTYLEIEEV